MTIAQIYEKAKQQLDKDEITIGEFSEIVDREFQERQPCEDCISREAVIKIFGEVHPMDYNTQAYIKNIQNLPSVTPSYNSIKTELKPCEDYISRQKLLSRIDAERKHLLYLKMDGAEHVIVHHARRIIEDMPSVILKTESEDEE